MTEGRAGTRVAVQGEAGCFSHAAALGYFGAVSVVSCRSFPELFEAVLEGRAERGCVPVENALAGAVTENLDLLVQHPLRAVGEVYQRVELCLAVRPGSAMGDVRRVASHPVALRQCRRFFEAHPGLVEVAAWDTAGGIRDLMREDDVRWDAAIGPALAAELYGADILERGIEDHRRNFTRFLMVARAGDAEEARGPGTKASIAFTVPHRPGSLHEAIGIFAAETLDLTRLESRPIPGRPWEYRFYADVRGGADESWDRAMAQLRALGDEVQILGRYAEAKAP
jgi:prephenate dehydratase